MFQISLKKFNYCDRKEGTKFQKYFQIFKIYFIKVQHISNSNFIQNPFKVILTIVGVKIQHECNWGCDKSLKLSQPQQ
jgi:hypothetical protein